MLESSKKIESLNKQMEKTGSQKVPTKEYEELTKQIDKLEDKWNDVNAKMERAKALGDKTSSKTFRGWQYDADLLKRKIGLARGDLQDLVNTGKAFEINTDKSSLEEALKAEKATLNDLSREYSEAVQQMDSAKQFGAVQNEIFKTDKQLASLTERMREWMNTGRDAKSPDSFRIMQEEAAQLQQQLLESKASLEEMANSYERSQGRITAATQTEGLAGRFASLGSAVQGCVAKFMSMFRLQDGLQNELQESGEKLKDFELIQEDGSKKSFSDAVQEQIGKIDELAGHYEDAQSRIQSSDKTKGIITRFRNLASTAKEAFAKISNGAWNASSGMGKLATMPLRIGLLFPRMLKNAVSAFVGIKKQSKDTARSVNKNVALMQMGFAGLGSKITGIGTRILRMAKTVFFFGIIRKALTALRSGISETFETYLTYDTALNNSINSLKASLNTLKGSLVSAFAPIISTVVPYLQTMVNWLVTAVNAVAQFTAALFGKSTYKKASAGVSSVGDAADSTAGSLSDAADAAEELKKALGGYDELNVIGDDDTSSSGSGSGSGSSDSGSGITYEDVDIGSGISDFAEKIKEAWANADFTEIGLIVGTKLRDALDSIPWDDIKAGAEKIAKVTATFLNGFFETPGLFDSIGNTVAQGLNTALTFAKTFLDTVHWDSIGSAITTGISSFFKNVDWSLLGGTISSAFISFFDFVRGLFEGIDWSNLPYAIVQGIKDFFTGFDWKSMFGSLGELIGTALRAELDFGATVTELLKEAFSNIGAYFEEYIEEAKEHGENWAKGILNGIIDVFRNIGTWIKENILEPFVDGFKNTFGIHSPASEPTIVELGKNIMLGILNGIIEGLSSIGTWIKENVLQPILNGFSNAKEFFSEAGQAIWNGITGAFDSVKNTVSVTVTAVKDKVFDTVSASWNNIKDKTSKLTAKAQNASSGVLSTLKSGWETVKTKTAALSGTAKNTASAVLSTLKSGWDTIKTRTATLTGKAKNSSSSILSTLKSGWDTIKTKTAELTAKAKNSNSSVLSTLKSAWSNIKTKTVTLTANILGKATGALKSLLGLASGGIIVNGQVQSIPQYGSGGTPSSGTLFWAGEAGTEIVGTAGGRTEVLNKSQIASAIYSAVLSAMSEAAAKIGNAVLAHMTDCTNAAIADLGYILSEIRYISSNMPELEYSFTGLPQTVSVQDVNRYRYAGQYSGSSAIDTDSLAEAVASRLNIQIENVLTLDSDPVYRKMVTIDRETVKQTGKSGFGR